MDVNSATEKSDRCEQCDGGLTTVATGRLETCVLSHGFLCKVLMKTVSCREEHRECAVPCTAP